MYCKIIQNVEIFSLFCYNNNNNNIRESAAREKT